MTKIYDSQKDDDKNIKQPKGLWQHYRTVKRTMTMLQENIPTLPETEKVDERI